MSEKDRKKAAGKDQGPGGGTPGSDSSLPGAKSPQREADGDQDATLDLGLDAIQSRLPYGSEDIADK